MAALTLSHIDYIFHHVFLPPQLPQRADDGCAEEAANDELLRLVSNASHDFIGMVGKDDVTAVGGIIERLLGALRMVEASKEKHQEAVLTCLTSLNEKDVLALRLRGQNAAVIFRRCAETTTVECFELLPTNQRVLETTTSLRRVFPAHGVELSNTSFEDTQFLSALASYLSRLDNHTVQEVEVNQNPEVMEERFCVHEPAKPDVAAALLMTILAAKGKPIPVTKVQKRYRDDVLSSNGSAPWRRSALWLLIKISIQTTFTHHFEYAKATTMYKNFMVSFLTAFLHKSPQLPSEHQYIVRAKIARRIDKLRNTFIPSIVSKAKTALANSMEKHETQWKITIEADNNRPVAVLMRAADNDTLLEVPDCSEYVDLLKEQNDVQSNDGDSLSFTQLEFVKFRDDGLPVLPKAAQTGQAAVHALTEVELWVLNSIDLWVNSVESTHDMDHFEALRDLSLRYREWAGPIYQGDPEQNSTMIITSAALWWAIDRLACCTVPLLKEYSPEINGVMFEALLLPRKEQMDLLTRIESHIRTRTFEASKCYRPSIFSNPTDSLGHFSALYFDRDPTKQHSNLRRQILRDAEKAQKRRRRKWEEMTESHRGLLAEREKTNCTLLENDEIRRGNVQNDTHHLEECKFCRLSKEAAALAIAPLEWPLPEEVISYKAVTFELRCPVPFSTWRDITWELLRNMWQESKIGEATPTLQLSDYEPLKKYVIGGQSSLGIASTTAPLSKARAKSLKFPVDKEDLFCPNGLTFQLFDLSRNTWVRKARSQDPKLNFAQYCHMDLPNGNYKCLQPFVNDTNHSQNGVLASQANCPVPLRLQEFLAFGSLRADSEWIQWCNIARGLAGCALTFNKYEVCLLTTMAAWQVGSSSTDSSRKSHAILTNSPFCEELLANLQAMLTPTLSNWKNHYIMQITVVILQRILCLNKNLTILEKCRSMLSECRSAARDWMTCLKVKLEENDDRDKLTVLRLSLLKAIFLCRMTFDGEPNTLANLLESPINFATWNLSSILLRRNLPNDETPLAGDLNSLLMRDRKLAWRIWTQAIISMPGMTVSGAIDAAMSQLRTLCTSRVTTWSSQDTQDSHGSRWFKAQIVRDPTQNDIAATFNVLDGDLLLAGKPLGILPVEYVQSEAYHKLFGTRLMPIVASDSPSMECMSAQELNDYRVYFGRIGNLCTIRLSNAKESLDFIPESKFIDHVPVIFATEFVHLYNQRTGYIEFRPASSCWQRSSQSWYLKFKPDGGAVLQNQDNYLIDIHSQVFTTISRIFNHFEKWDYIHVTTSSARQLQVELPRLGLHFSLNQSGQLENQELRLVIDPDQSLGTLIGLQSRLVLYDPRMALRDSRRSLCRKTIVPVGKVTIVRDEANQHVLVDIGSKSRQIDYCAFDIDSIVGRLRGDGTCASELYQAYLHAITSSMLKDPLTGRSGTDEALALLRQQYNSVIFPITDNEYNILCLINCMTPERSFIPKSNGTTYHTVWEKNVSPLMCRQEFANWAEKIVKKSNTLAAFYPKGTGARVLKSRGDEKLIQKAAKRNSVLRPQGFRCSLIDPRDDINYVSRDTIKTQSRIRNVYEIVSFITRWNENRSYTPNFSQDLRSLGEIAGFEKSISFDEPLSDILKLPLGKFWGALWKLCCGTDGSHADKLVFLFGTIAYGHEFDDLESLKTLLAFAMVPTLRTLPNAPMHTSYDFAAGLTADVATLSLILGETAHKFGYSRTKLPKPQKESEKGLYKLELSRQIGRATQYYLRQWPCKIPSMADPADFKLLSIDKAHQQIDSAFLKWHKNAELQRYIDGVQNVLDRNCSGDEEPSGTWSGDWPHGEKISRSFDLHNLPWPFEVMRWGAPNVLPQRPEFKYPRMLLPCQPKQELRRLIEDIDGLSDESRCVRSSEFAKRYKKFLLQSLDSLEMSFSCQDRAIPEELLTRHILENHDDCRRFHESCTQRLSAAFRPPALIHRYSLLKPSGLWPDPSIYEILTYLGPRYQSKLPQGWETGLRTQAMSVTAVQRAQRLFLALRNRDYAALFPELDNYCTTNSMVSYPQWLATEIEGDFRTRELQVRVATDMIEPASGTNNLLQLSMGEGKSSVITPLILAASANGHTLVRMSSPKALIPQMHSLLARRNCGLNDQPLFFIPFSRDMPMNEGIMNSIRDILQQCILNHGILIILPEHILSLKLLIQEKRVYGPIELVQPLQDISDGLHQSRKDFLDESDEILDPRSQLIYMVGHPKSMDGMPERGIIVQDLLGLVSQHALSLSARDPEGIRAYRTTDVAFPFIEVKSTAAGAKLIEYLVASIGQSSLRLLNLTSCLTGRITAILSFISDINVTQQTCAEVEKYTSEQPVLLKQLLVLRGLLAHNVLMHTLTEKRWSIDYGLHPSRCLSAVPYRAHRLPTISAEFAQPEVHLVLTCLSYYYQGVSPDQMKRAFEALDKRPDPSYDFGLWTSSCDNLPDSLRDHRSVNLADEDVFMEKLYPALKHSKALADFFLVHFVYPKEAKEFSEKFSSSGWDIALTSGAPDLTTGFSGTSDNNALLPCNITHHNTSELESTSAHVLDLVLQPKNSRYARLKPSSPGLNAVKKAVNSITCADSEIRVIIDVGAQLIGLANAEVVKIWLDFAHQAEAGVFLDSDGDLMVMDRHDKIEQLCRSSFRMRMDVCVVFLDEANTRGIDIKMPENARAAIIVGPRLTKDRLVQGCLRLRGLARNQSLMFFAPPTVDLEIRTLRGKNYGEELCGYDVLSWALHQTCLQHDRYRPLHILQGLSYHSRQDVARQYPFDSEEQLPPANSPLVESETQGLHDLYAPMQMRTEAEPFLISKCRQMQNTDVQRLIADWDSLKVASPSNAAVYEEHQREVMQEVEQQVQVERPALMNPAKPKCSAQLRNYVEQGTKDILLKLASVHEAIIIKSSASKELVGTATIWPHLRVSNGFADVVLRPDYGHNNSTIRPANWILVNCDPTIEADLLLITPYEAGQLFEVATAPDAKVRLFSYEPRVSRGSLIRDPQAIVLSDEIVDDWSSLVPPHISRELQSFAGQLYLPNYEEYLAFRSLMSGYLRFYKEWSEIRCRGEDFSRTHMGQIVEGRILKQSDFDSKPDSGGGFRARGGSRIHGSNAVGDEIMTGNEDDSDDDHHGVNDGGDGADRVSHDNTGSRCQPSIIKVDDNESVDDIEPSKEEEHDDYDSKDWLKTEEDEGNEATEKWEKGEVKDEDLKMEDVIHGPISEDCKLEADEDDDSFSFNGFSPSSSKVKCEDEELFIAPEAGTRLLKKRRLA